MLSQFIFTRRRCPGLTRYWCIKLYHSHTYTHQCHIKQEDLQKEAQGGACDLIRSPSDRKTHLTPHSQSSFPLLLRWELKRGQKRRDYERTNNDWLWRVREESWETDELFTAWDHDKILTGRVDLVWTPFMFFGRPFWSSFPPTKIPAHSIKEHSELLEGSQRLSPAEIRSSRSLCSQRA